jgi:Zn-dependent protease/predicted transcriptional regulator
MGGFRLGSIFGFEIRIDYSWFIIFLLVLWTLASGVFPATFPNQQRSVYFAMAAGATLLFFASIVAHELSHSLMARAKGVPVTGITLFIFGGMAHTRMEFEEPGDEFRIAIVGPLASLAIAAAFQIASMAVDAAGAHEAVVRVAGYLAYINVVLAVFNLLPAFPLDGGRVFRSIAWKITGDLQRATRMAATGGKFLAYALIAIGFLNFFAGNIVGGIWTVLIGWFVRQAAESSYLQLMVRRSLDGVRADQVMTPDPYTVSPEISLESFVDDHVLRGRHHAYPVVDEDRRPIGIVSLEAVRRVPRDEWPRTSVSDAMVPVDENVIVSPEESMDRVLDRISGSRARRILVARQGQLAGIITSHDIARLVEGVQLKGEV